eukprot:scpid81044/ scgid25912/ 
MTNCCTCMLCHTCTAAVAVKELRNRAMVVAALEPGDPCKQPIDTGTPSHQGVYVQQEEPQGPGYLAEGAVAVPTQWPDCWRGSSTLRVLPGKGGMIKTKSSRPACHISRASATLSSGGK